MTETIKPPFTEEAGRAKVQAAEDAWNSRDPNRVALAYTEDSDWRNRALFFKGRDAIRQFLSSKWQKELHYRLKKNCGPGPTIGFLSVSFTNGRVPVAVSGSAHMVTNIGSLTRKA